MNKAEIGEAFGAEVTKLPGENYTDAFDKQPWHFIGLMVDRCVFLGWRLEIKSKITDQTQEIEISVDDIRLSTKNIIEALPLVYLIAWAMIERSRQRTD